MEDQLSRQQDRLPARFRVGRLIAIIVGIGLLAVGGVIPGFGVAQGDGYFTTQYGDIKTSTAAAITREVDVEGRNPTDPQNDPGDLARVRIQTKPINQKKPMFIGIAKRSDVQRYLSGTAHDEMSTFDVNPFAVTFNRHPGSTRVQPPGEQKFWAASASGAGPLELQWNKSVDEWVVVAMNADGRQGVAVSANIGLRFGFLLPLGFGLLACALAIAAVLILARRKKSIDTAVSPHRNGTSPW